MITFRDNKKIVISFFARGDIMLGKSHTAYDVMKEYLLTEAELCGKYDFPALYSSVNIPGSDTIDFENSFGRKIKNHRDLTVNFYIDDMKFQRMWNNPDKYIEHLKCFHSVISPDFSIAVGNNGMSVAMQLWNKYRNHVLGHYMALNGVKIIPNVNVLPEYCWDWCFDGLPQESLIACSTVGRMQNKESKKEFCDGFSEMVKRLKPSRVIVVGKLPEEIRNDVEIINFKSRGQKARENFGN